MGEGTLNTCYEALDRHVIRGAADRAAVHHLVGGRWVECSYADLLSDVAAFAGTLRGFGVGPGEVVVLTLAPSMELLVSVLAGARLGGVPAMLADLAPEDLTDGIDRLEPVVVVGGPPDRAGRHRPRAWVTGPGEAAAGPEAGPDVVSWELAMRAGRTDPAACRLVPAGQAAYVVPGEDSLTRATGAHAAEMSALLGGLGLEDGDACAHPAGLAADDWLSYAVYAPLLAGLATVLPDLD